DQSLTLGGSFGSHDSYTFAGPAPINVRNFTIGGGGFADFHQAGGTVNADHISLGEGIGSSGSYTLTGKSKVNVGSVDVGGAGDGHVVVASSDASFNAKHIYVGRDAGSTGTFDLIDGKVSDESIAVGVHGDGVFTQTGGHHNIRGAIAAAPV